MGLLELKKEFDLIEESSQKIPNITIIDEEKINPFIIKCNKSNEVVDSLESMTSSLFNNNEKSEEVYFGLNCNFSKEMINLISLLREELKLILGGNWKDENKRSILIKNELKNKDNIKGLTKIIEDIGSCIARNCNIEKCYISLSNDINAYTLPLVWDSSLILSNLKDSVEKTKGFYFIKSKFIRTDKDIQSQLLKFDDIIINKNGYKFIESKGKIFLINIGLPLIVDDNFESTPEEICSVIFHELGHNFQQILHGTNQLLVDTYIRNQLECFIDNRFYNFIEMIISFLINNITLKNILKSTKNDINYRFYIIKSLLFDFIRINPDSGEIITRSNIGDIEKNNIQNIIDKAKETNTLKQLSFAYRILNIVGSSLIKIIKLIFIPITRSLNVIKYRDLNKRYSELIKLNKSYEQFADLFAVSYGFASSSSKYYIRIQNHIKKVNETNSSSYLSLLNHIPILSKMELMNELLYQKMKFNLSGYDENYVRISQIYKSLDFELTNNKDLSNNDKNEIIKQMEIVKKDFDFYKQLEIENITKNKSLIGWLLKKTRSGDIETISSESGIVEGVIEIINNFEKTKTIQQSEILNKIKTDNINNVDNISKINNILKDGLNFIKEKMNIIIPN